MPTRKYVSLSKLSSFLDNLKVLFAKKTDVVYVSDSNEDIITEIEGTLAASDISYSPLASGLSSTNVQDAITEISSNIKTVPDHNHDDRYYTESEIDAALSINKTELDAMLNEVLV